MAYNHYSNYSKIVSFLITDINLVPWPSRIMYTHANAIKTHLRFVTFACELIGKA